MLCNHQPGQDGDGERCANLGWQQLTERRVRGDLIFTYQHLHGNAHLKLDLPWVAPLLRPAASVHANDMRHLSTAREIPQFAPSSATQEATSGHDGCFVY